MDSGSSFMEKRLASLLKNLEVVRSEIIHNENLAAKIAEKLEVLKQEEIKIGKEYEDIKAKYDKILELESQLKKLNSDFRAEMNCRDFSFSHPSIDVITSQNTSTHENPSTNLSWSDEMDNEDNKDNENKPATFAQKVANRESSVKSQRVLVKEPARQLQKRQQIPVPEIKADLKKMVKDLKIHCSTCCAKGSKIASDCKMKIPSNIFENMPTFSDFLDNCNEIPTKDSFLFRVSGIISTLCKKISAVTDSTPEEKELVESIYSTFTENDNTEKNIFFNTCCSLSHCILVNDFYYPEKAGDLTPFFNKNFLKIFADVYCSGMISVGKDKAKDNGVTRFVRATIRSCVE